MKLKISRKRILPLIAVMAVFVLTMVVFAEGEAAEYQSSMYATVWSLMPPIVAIALALITKEVYISLFVGILAGAFMYADFNPVRAMNGIVDTMVERVGDGWNVGILIFLVALGIIVALMNKAGGSAAYGRWASTQIESKRGAMLSTFGLGVLIFVDDYFNCLTVGSVMSPVTDKHKISRAKLAYIIDATAAPICIIAPISSWAAAVTSSAVGEIDGFSLFLQAIPYNFYALLTIVMIIVICTLNFDFGPMKKYEALAQKGDLFGGTGNEYAKTTNEENPRGKVIDLILPVIFLIASCIICMIYTGGFFEGESFIDAFANSDASVGLALGSLISLLFIFILYIPRRVISFREFADCLPEGFRQMVPAILILTFAWTLSGFCNDRLGAGEFVGTMVQSNLAATAILPAVLFLVALGLAFATGTSWGTFAILIPIAQSIFPGEMSQTLIISISAILAGAVCGDHISPISDTTIMASTGAQVNHVLHVSTQSPYALLVAAVSFIGYLLTMLTQNWIVVLAICIVVLVGALLLIRSFSQKSPPEQAADKASIE